MPGKNKNKDDAGNFSVQEIHFSQEAYEINESADYIIIVSFDEAIGINTMEQGFIIPRSCYIILDNCKNYSIRPATNKDVTAFIICINGRIFPDVNRSPQTSRTSAKTMKFHFFDWIYALDENNLGNSITQLIRRERSPLPSTKHVSALRMVEEMRHIQIHLNQCLQNIPAKNRSVAKTIFYNLLKAKLHILTHLDKPVHLFKMARVANISESHFSRSFKVLFNVSPVQYHIQIRIDKAAELMRRTSLPICDIAEELGFNNLSSFGRSFKKVYGISPRVYKKYNSLL